MSNKIRSAGRYWMQMQGGEEKNQEHLMMQSQEIRRRTIISSINSSPHQHICPEEGTQGHTNKLINGICMPNIVAPNIGIYVP